MTDPIADMLTRIRNAQLTRKNEVCMPYSNLKFELAKILEKEGYISSVKKRKERESVRKNIIVTLKRDEDGTGAIKHIARVSKPGQRIYVKSTEIQKVLQGLGIAVISTSQGLMTSYGAKARKLGGEIICNVW
ncbi:30S ribosomal protein S8 [Patescibacteria group bacterium]|nr:30S ribosomal protein S8 [Patescibacteria group bacterium]